MLLQYCSDLHLEFAQNQAYLDQHPIDAVGDILMLAGDITRLNYYQTRNFDKEFFRTLSRQFRYVLWIPGNHEFYRSEDAQLLDKPLWVELHKNVYLLNNVVTVIEGVRFVLTTLWTHLDKVNERIIDRRMADFSLIQYAGQTLTPAIYVNRLHQPALNFLRVELIKPFAGPTVVVTHHMPSLHCVHPKHEGSVLQQGFVNDLDTLILETQPEVWIYGHSHGNRPPIQLGKTRLLTNMLGYCGYDEHHDYRNPAVVEIGI
jgi:Icc-related predicted phosphoesterase